MSLHRVRITLKAPLGTPLTSGTLFGHLCWAKREADGEDALVAWLKALPEAPWALSDGFPADHLSRPLVPRQPPPRPKQMTREILKDFESAKARNKLPWVRSEDWRRLRGRVSDPVIGACATSAPAASQRIAHNAIDRLTGSTPGEGGLYFVDEDWGHAEIAERDVYVRAGASPGELHTLFAAVGEGGYGRDATWGRGHFTVDGIDDASWLDDHAGNRMMSLSHGCLTPKMGEPRYKLFTHFGKVGAGLLAAGVIAWKRPLLLARPGCTFTPADAGPFGRWLAGVHQDPNHPEVGHNAFHLAILYTEAEA